MERNTSCSQWSSSLGDAEDDWSIYAKFEKGDKAAFHRLFDRYKNRIFNLSYRFVRNREAAEDIAQEVLIKIYEKKVKFRPNTKFSTWIYRVAANASLGHLRKGKFFGFSIDQPAGYDEDGATPISENIGTGDCSLPSKDLARKELSLAVDQALLDLPEDLRSPIVLFQFEEHSYREIAEILGISVKAVERRIYRAKGVLRNKLSNNIL